MIKEQEAGMPSAEACRKHGLSRGVFYKYRSKYGGIEVSDVAELKAMEDENAKLKWLLADAMLDYMVLKDLFGKELTTPNERRRGFKRARGSRTPMPEALGQGERWSLDFLSDTFGASRRFRILAVNDGCCRENFCLIADTSISGTRVARELDALVRV